MRTKTPVKDKILLLIILAIAAGFFIIASHENIGSKIITQTTTKTSEKKDQNIFNCDMYRGKLAQVLDDKEIDLSADKTCLYVGCGGFTY